VSSQVPKGLGRAGAALWCAVSEAYELEPHELRLLLEMARTVDSLDQLAATVARDGVLDPETGRAHPALVEARQQRITYARLAAALRLPAGDEDDQAPGRRPQRRVGARGVYGIRGAVA
jgi:hypothetical protein